jgi:hypothetical protein
VIEWFREQRRKQSIQSKQQRRAEPIRTLGGDEAVHLAEEQRVLGLEKLHLGDRGGAAGHRGDGGVLLPRERCRGAGDAEDDERDVVPGVAAHHVGRGGRAVQSLHLAARVLDHHGRRLRRLAVAHLSLGPKVRQPGGG